MTTQTTAWCWQGPGNPTEVLHATELTLPPLAPDEVLISNQVIALNPVDWKLIRHGHPDWQPGHIPGVDAMGVVTACGAAVHHLQPGTRVAYHTDLRRSGSFARHTQVKARALLRVPDSLPDTAAAAFPCPGLTAWQALAKLPVLNNLPLLIAGAGSNVGRFATQLALQAGARVFASAGPAQHAWLKQCGVIAVADYHDADWLAQLRHAHHDQPFDAAIDLVSSAQASQLVEALGFYGHLVAVLGRVEHNPRPAFTHCISLHEIALGAQHAFGSDRQWQQLVAAGEQLLQQMAQGQLTLPRLILSDWHRLPEQLSALEAGGQSAKYLIQVQA